MTTEPAAEKRSYDFAAIEPRWQQYWEDNSIFRQPSPGEPGFDPSKPKIYILDMFPYPSGSGLHVGHPEGYTATDIVSRYKRAKGFNVLHPMGWDAFGLPAERHAMREGIHPAITTKKNCDNFRRQIKALGLSYDWSREVNTTDPKYYKWTQWIFSRLYEKGLAYYEETWVNWDPVQKLVVANEEVGADGTHVDTGTPIVKKKLKQWILKITAYAERLLADIELLDWPEGIKEQQRNWIGKSTGATVRFDVAESDAAIEVYTTRPDTLFGATYMVLAPEHPLVDTIVSVDRKQAVDAYREKASKASDIDRGAANREKTGEFTGAYAINPVNNQKIPVWIADYVMMGYGTGAIMAVPAHDERDFAFAKKFNIPVVCILDPENRTADRDAVLAGDSCWTGDGVYTRSASTETGADINGLNLDAGKKKIIGWLESQSRGKGSVQYKLRDWVFSRQRYWGEPIPIVHWEDGTTTLLPESELPLRQPEVTNYQPSDTGESPLANAGDWLNVVDPKTGKKGRRETNTMPQWAGSCWYYLRFIDPTNDTLAWSPDAEKYWMPVDLYVGGAEHAVLHLLYARFWHKVLFDLGVVSTPEPFQKLFNQGMILSYAYKDANGKPYPTDMVSERDGKYFLTDTGEEVFQFVTKMSKSLKNVVNPDDVIREYGADTLRLYEMYMGPLESSKPWDTKQINGVHRFLQRSWRLITDDTQGLRATLDAGVENGAALERVLHRTIQKVGEDIEAMRFNTAIAAMIEFVNAALREPDKLSKCQAERFVQLLAPFAPHIAEELWHRLGRTDRLAYAAWPSFDPAMTVDNIVEIAVQITGKVRARISVAVDADKDAMLADAKAAVADYLKGKTIVKEIVVPGKIVNIVVK